MKNYWDLFDQNIKCGKIGLGKYFKGHARYFNKPVEGGI